MLWYGSEFTEQRVDSLALGGGKIGYTCVKMIGLAGGEYKGDREGCILLH
jgi:hypothetical protein